MKEFVEKLIERLSNAYDECIRWNHHKVNAYGHAIKIVNQLAEEYKSKLIEDIEFAIEASNTNDNYMTGLRNGMRYCLALIDGKEPEFEECNQDSTKKNQWWILCSEKLPEKRSWYLALFKESSTGFVGLPYIADYLMGNHTNWTTKDGWIIKDCTDSDKANEYFKDLECVAWQPLPNPCSFTHEKELVEFCKPEEKPKFSNEELDRIMDKILDTTQEETNFYAERFNRVL